MELFHAGLQFECSSFDFAVGETVMCSCYSDIKSSSSLQWYSGESSNLNQTELEDAENLTIAVTTDDEGLVYTCSLSSDCGIQEKSITINATGIYISML